jgi:hypothetical protein
LKRVWKILNLDYLLTDEDNIHSYSGKKKGKIRQNRNLSISNDLGTARPRTNTSYKQKLLYVNYLY